MDIEKQSGGPYTLRRVNLNRELILSETNGCGHPTMPLNTNTLCI